MKLFAAFMLVLAGLVPTRADTTTQTWTVTASCFSGNPTCIYPAKTDAVFTTQLETGTFFEVTNAGGQFFTATEPVVTNITGTFDGMAMSLVPTAEPFQPWITPGDPEHVSLMAGGIEYIFDTDINLIDVAVANNQAATIEFLNWGIVQNVPGLPHSGCYSARC